MLPTLFIGLLNWLVLTGLDFILLVWGKVGFSCWDFGGSCGWADGDDGYLFVVFFAWVWICEL